MFAFILAIENLPFTIALAFMLGIALLEGLSALLGLGISSFLDSLLPDVEMDLDADGPDAGELGSPAALSRLLGWINFGKVPVLVLLVLFLFGFGIAGLILQSVAFNILGRLLPGLLGALIALVPALYFVRLSGGLVARIIPQDETESVSEKSFIGRIAVINAGEAAKGKPAQAKVHDKYGRAHYLMVAPDREEEVLVAGQDLLLVRQAGAVFYAVPNTSSALIDDQA